MLTEIASFVTALAAVALYGLAARWVGAMTERLKHRWSTAARWFGSHGVTPSIDLTLSQRYVAAYLVHEIMLHQDWRRGRSQALVIGVAFDSLTDAEWSATRQLFDVTPWAVERCGQRGVFFAEPRANANEAAVNASEAAVNVVPKAYGDA